MPSKTSVKVNTITTGFIDVPGKISMNIYAQGCKKRCVGCHNMDLLKFDGGQELFLSDIDEVINDHYLCNWVCWLGGDAVYQETSVIHFNREFHKEKLKVALYTGKLFSQLSQTLIDGLDLIIDGEWTGVPVTDKDTNQQIWVPFGRDWIRLPDWDTLTTFLSNGQ